MKTNLPKNSMNWIKIEDEKMPFEEYIIVKHKYGVDAIAFFSGSWKFWYSGKAVELKTLQLITEWFKPE